MYEDIVPHGEFHHFQLVGQNGEVPMSISLLVHFNRTAELMQDQAPISANDIIELHEALEGFDGDFIKAFKAK